MPISPAFTICVLCYGDHLQLARRCLSSIGLAIANDPRFVADIRVGLNEVVDATEVYVRKWADEVWRRHHISTAIYQSERNVFKEPMFRRLVHDSLRETAPLVMWFDDDSYLVPTKDWWQRVVSACDGRDMIGQLWYMPLQGNQWQWICDQPWFNPNVGLPPLFDGRPSMRFCQGAWVVFRHAMLKQYNWPIPELRHNGGDSMLGELARHRHLLIGEFSDGVRINADDQGRHSGMPRRGYSENNIGVSYLPGQPLSTAHHDFQLNCTVIGDLTLPDETTTESSVIKKIDRHQVADDFVAMLFRDALALQKQGDLVAARELYEQLLVARPNHAAALHFLGVIAFQQDIHKEAVHLICKAIAIDSTQAHFHSNLGLAFKALNRLDEAGDCFQMALTLKPDDTVAFNNLGIVRLEQHRTEDAAYCFRQSRRLNDRDAMVYVHLGRTLREQGKVDQAIEQFQKAIQIDLDCVEAYCRLGAAYRDQGDLPTAITQFEHAIKIAPDHLDALNNLGAAFIQTDRSIEAEIHLRHAISIDPKHAMAYSNLGIALMNLDRLDEAQVMLSLALKIKPDLAAAKSNLGALYLHLGQIDDAIVNLEDALRIQPNIIDARWNRSLALLSRGDFRQGWLEYEWRWLKPGKRRHMPRPLWDGSICENGDSLPSHSMVSANDLSRTTPSSADEHQRRTILLHAEQGLGDTIQFIRYAANVKARGWRVMLACQQSLIPLLSRCPSLDAVVAQQRELPTFDFHSPLLSLPAIFKTQFDSVPAVVPYLFPDPILIESWRDRIAVKNIFTIGIVWQGNPSYSGDRHRSIPLRQFAPIATVPGVRLVSLQKGFGCDQITQVKDEFDVLPLEDVDEQNGAFMDTVAIMRNLDLVITSDTVIPHLAGALGVPVWMAVSTSPDWRWMHAGDSSPWYPSMRIFRQQQRGNWSDVFERMRMEISRIRKF